ncbi:T9SS type A sorting domain-containing protein [Fodinibius halophilus]|uniref:T9SS type A sorting domain-containing protein n=1 Tax=Fodinibius halophilus TaxID=1736908 RepID=A0A6M1T9H2_9BACT|nr:T9SS type A sorting domain-containing protein [Fodinibius halophilus]NGP90105.1 T9SS type A sorting domain-containing protein [Fodinibius halophilus]
MNKYHLSSISLLNTFVFVTVLMLAVPTLSQAQIYVDHTATGADDGSSWSDAYTTLQGALQAASSSDQIWIAEGTYKPTTGTDRTASFSITGTKDGIKIYGGFEQGDTFSDRNSTDHPVLLSGDIGTANDQSDNSYNVFSFDGRSNNITTSTILDGVTITSGNADGSGFYEKRGGGILNLGTSGGVCNPTISNVTFTNNSATLGGAMFNEGYNGESSPDISSSTFTGNNAANLGGAIYSYGNSTGNSNPTISASTFENNSATLLGGALFNSGNGGTSNPTITNSTFRNNTAASGGAIYNDGANNGQSNPVITSSVFKSNTVTTSSPGNDGNGGAIFNGGSGGQSNPTIKRSIFISNSAETDGGAIFNDGRTSGESNPVITNTVFANNSTTNGNGGAFYSNGQDGVSSPVITNATFTGNTSGADGGAITNDVTASGSGTVEPSITNTILYGNVAGTGGEQIYNRGNGVAPTVGYTLIEAGTSGVTNSSGGTINYTNSNGSTVTFSQSTNLQGDPKFTDDTDPDGTDDTFFTSDDGLDLEASSSSIEAGDNSATNISNTDITGEPRIIGIEVDLGAYEGPLTVQITGSEGWRIMTAPTGGLSYTGLLGPLWLQGMSGADVTNGTANLHTWDEATQQFQAVSDATTVPNAGQGFLVYVYDDQNYDGTNEGFPKTLTVDQSRSTGSVSPSLSYNNNGTSSDGFNLVGNPYNVTINWDDPAFTKNNLNASIYVWDSSANSGTGAYLSWNGSNGTLPNGLIAPWQGFWIEANAPSPVLEFTENVQSAGGAFYKEEETTSPEITFTLEGENMESKTILTFDKRGQKGKDPLDAWKLESLNDSYLSLYTTNTERHALDINVLPIDFKNPLHLDLDFKGSDLGGTYTLRWDPQALPSNIAVTLKDNHTNQIISLNSADEYSFKVANQHKNSTRNTDHSLSGTTQYQKGFRPHHSPIPTVLKAKATNSRFKLSIDPNSKQGDLNEIPNRMELKQNYPNPFNPSTVIRYGVPKQTEVQLNIYDVLGRKIRTLVNTQKSAGRYEASFDASNLASGLYLYRLKIGAKVLTKKMMLIK